jgi:hypothetical protein
MCPQIWPNNDGMGSGLLRAENTLVCKVDILLLLNCSTNDFSGRLDSECPVVIAVHEIFIVYK